MKITRLRILGFKSFVDPTELVIEPGLTGVVGPNGCGKSNLLEALRWVMGETSHKSMRAAAMDDVIFSGTNSRPERQSAEVTMFLDNSARRAPADFNDNDTIEITRRIERDAGSAYRINGREVRARDVKVLFEDAATGARSPALVRQGQIGELVNAKPEQRRRILEDAAGIAGLHTRRHEAELRLRAAEANVERLSDVVGQLQSQSDSLKRQARQARRYKEISGEIRQQEALAMHLTWQDAQASVEHDEAQLTEAMMRLGAATEAEAKSFNEELRLAEELPPLREAEAQKAAALARFKIEQENLEREAQRAADRARELDARVKQLEADLARESGFIREAKETLVHLDADLAAIKDADIDAVDEEADERSNLEQAEARRVETDAHFADITHRAAEARARLRSLEEALKERKDLVATITRQVASLDAQIADITTKAPDRQQLDEISEHDHTLSQEITDIEAQTIAAEETGERPIGMIVDREKWETLLTGKLVENNSKDHLVPASHLVPAMIAAEERICAHPRYNGFYNGRVPFPLDIPALLNDQRSIPATEEELFGEKMQVLFLKLRALDVDMQELSMVGNGLTMVQTFEYEGVTMKRKEAKSLLEKLVKEKQELLEQLRAQEELVFLFYSRKDGGQYVEEQKKMSQLSLLNKRLAETFSKLQPTAGDLEVGLQLTPLQARHLQSQVLKYAEEVRKALAFADTALPWQQYGTFNLGTTVSAYLCEVAIPQGPADFSVDYFSSLFQVCRKALLRLSNLVTVQQEAIIAEQDRIAGIAAKTQERFQPHS